MRFVLIMSLHMQTTIISYLVYKLTKDPLSLGMLGLWEVIPAIGFSFISGPFIDQREKRTILMSCIATYLVLSAAFILLATNWFQNAAGIKATVWIIYCCIFFSGIIRAFISPSNFALLGMIVPRKLYANATTWSSTAWQTGAVIGPLIGGVLIAVSGFEFSLFGVFALQVIAAIALSRIPKQEVAVKKKEAILKSLKEGLQFVFKTQAILAVLSLDMFAVLFGGAVALLPVYAEDILKVGEVGYGWLRAAPAIGAVICLAILSFIPLKKNPGLKLLLSVAAFGLTTIIFGISTSFALSFTMLLLGGLVDSVSVVIRGTILQLYTPDEMRGRVAAVNTMFISSSNELGALESGGTAKLMGTIPAVVFGGVMTLVVVGVTYFKAPVLQTLKLDPNDQDKT